jgi:hypothetical protein
VDVDGGVKQESGDGGGGDGGVTENSLTPQSLVNYTV